MTPYEWYKESVHSLTCLPLTYGLKSPVCQIRNKRFHGNIRHIIFDHLSTNIQGFCKRFPHPLGAFGWGNSNDPLTIWLPQHPAVLQTLRHSNPQLRRGCINTALSDLHPWLTVERRWRQALKSKGNVVSRPTLCVSWDGLSPPLNVTCWRDLIRQRSPVSKSSFPVLASSVPSPSDHTMEVSTPSPLAEWPALLSPSSPTTVDQPPSVWKGLTKSIPFYKQGYGTDAERIFKMNLAR